VWKTSLKGIGSKYILNADMNRLPTRIIVFGITLTFEIFVVWMLAKPTNVPLQSKPNEDQQSSVPPTKPSIVASEPTKEFNDNLEETRIEQFSDEKRIGRHGKNKIEIKCFSQGDRRYAQIRFFTRSEYGAWIEMQSFKFDKDGVTDCDPVIKDFNNDGFDDFTYQSNVAARGANEVRKLFIYDKNMDELVYIENSEDYPNLEYNKTLKCVDSFIVTGTTETVFLRIEGNSLREFASVENGLTRDVAVIDKAGNSRIVRRQKYNIDDFGEAFRRFSSYDPLR
jgi:hypothetical protein